MSKPTFMETMAINFAKAIQNYIHESRTTALEEAAVLLEERAGMRNGNNDDVERILLLLAYRIRELKEKV